MSAFTPGPWQWGSNDCLWGGERGTQEILKAADDGRPWGMHSAMIEHHHDKDQAAANRYLIAAAPLLLEALDQALRFIEVSTAYRGPMTASQVEEQILNNRSISETEIGANSCNTLAEFSFAKARAAISQARGEK